ncbi:MAG: hypothetical protein ACRCV0_02555 [Brevinema sp.]
MDQLEGDKIFVVTKLGLDTIRIDKKSDVLGNPDKFHKKLKFIGLFANFLSGSQEIKAITITSYQRTVDTQSLIVWKDAINYPKLPHEDALYKFETGKGIRKIIDSNTNYKATLNEVEEYLKKHKKEEEFGITNEVLTVEQSAQISNTLEYLKKRIEGNSGFSHVTGNGDNTIDIGANPNSDARKPCFINSLEHIGNQKTIINKFLKEGTSGEINCHHIVFY